MPGMVTVLFHDEMNSILFSPIRATNYLKEGGT
jgi:hypothetical protein